MKSQLIEWLYCLKLYLRTCLFIASPSDLPHSLSSVVLSLFAYAVVGYILLGDQYSVIAILGHIGAELLILFAFSFVVLRFQNRQSRLLQTMSALIGSSLIISLVSIPLMWVLPQPAAPGQIEPITLQVNLLLLFWSLAVISLIFKRAFELSTIAAGFLAFNYFLLYELIIINFLQ